MCLACAACMLIAVYACHHVDDSCHHVRVLMLYVACIDSTRCEHASRWIQDVDRYVDMCCACMVSYTCYTRCMCMCACVHVDGCARWHVLYHTYVCQVLPNTSVSITSCTPHSTCHTPSRSSHASYVRCMCAMHMVEIDSVWQQAHMCLCIVRLILH